MKLGDAVAARIPRDRSEAVVSLDGREVRLTNLRKPFWPDLGVTKGDLLRYYATIAPALLPHIRGRAMVMRRYPDGAGGKSFFMKRAPAQRPDWIATCPIEHGAGDVIDFPVIDDAPSLLWVVNLGCIDLNPWVSRRDHVDRPDFLHFDLDPGERATWAQVVEAAGVVREALDALEAPSYVKTSGSRGLHVYVPIVRGPPQRTVRAFAKALALELARRRPDALTATYALARRPGDRVLVDYNQNAWGQTLASIYSVRPRAAPTVSTPLGWSEVARGVAPERFTIETVPPRVRKVGDLWAPLLASRGRFDLGRFAR